MDCGKNKTILCTKKRFDGIFLLFFITGMLLFPCEFLFSQRYEYSTHPQVNVPAADYSDSFTRPSYTPSTQRSYSETGSLTNTVSDAYSNYPDPNQNFDKNSPLARGDYDERLAAKPASNPRKLSSPRRDSSAQSARQLPSSQSARPLPSSQSTRPMPSVLTTQSAPSFLPPSAPKQGSYQIRVTPAPKPEEEYSWTMPATRDLPPANDYLDSQFLTKEGNTKALSEPPLRSPGVPRETRAGDETEDTYPEFELFAPQNQSSPYRLMEFQQDEQLALISHVETAQTDRSTAANTYYVSSVAPSSGGVSAARLSVSGPEEALSAHIPVKETSGGFPQLVFSEESQYYELNIPSAPWFVNYIGVLPYDEHRFIQESLLLRTQRYSLLEASIIASHPSKPEVASRLLQRYREIESRLLSQISPRDTKLQRAEKILTFMHRELLRGGYQLEQTTMENLFTNGRYNCVTATILYCCLGRAAGLEVKAVELPGHAMCWVKTEQGELDVETTCATWFQYLDDPDTRNRVIHDLIRQAQADVNTAQVRPVTDRELIAKVYYNRGVDFLAEKNFSRALEANAIALLLDPSSATTKGNLLATMNNWSILLCHEGKYPQAAQLLREGIREEPDYATFRNNHVHVYHRWIEALYQAGHMQEALQIADVAATEQPTEPHFGKLQQQIRERMGSTAGAVRQIR